MKDPMTLFSPFLLLIAVFSACVVGCQNDGVRQTAAVGAAEPDVGQGLIEKVVLETLDRSGRSGSLVYRGYCGPSGIIHNRVKPKTSQAASPLQAMQEMLASEPDFMVEEDANGLIRVSARSVNRDLLDLKLAHFSFTGEYDPAQAIRNLLAAPEVAKFMQDHNIHLEPSTGGIEIARGKDQVQLTGTLDNASVAQILDRMTQSFPGLWIYKECVQNNGDKFVAFEFQFVHPNGRKRDA
jgi:hypothetical protein